MEDILDNLKGLTDLELKKISIIVNCTTLREDRYKNIYGKDALNIVHKNIKLLQAILPPENISVQIIKIKEIEDEVDAYFSYFEKQAVNVVFQKYNRYINLLKEKRVSDLTPLKREFCWHLARDLYINSDGSVSLCKQLPKSIATQPGQILGNLHSDNILDLWRKGIDAFHNSLTAKHHKIPASCLNCDEWYTFNA
jgi:spiro-SPASM protein